MRRAILALAALGAAACLEKEEPRSAGDHHSVPQDPVPPEDVAGVAAEKYPNLEALWEKAIYVSCGPNNGVCHRNKQFPHMEFASSLLGSIDASCNQLRDDPKTISNLCEPIGDQLRIGETFLSRVAWVSAVPDDNDPTSVQLAVRDPIPSGIDTSDVAIVREHAGLSDTEIPIPSSAVISAKGTVLTLDHAALAFTDFTPDNNEFAGNLADFFLPPVYMPVGDELQIQLGDPNGDGIFGHELGGAVIKPGHPEKSYLMLRVMSPLDFGDSELTSMMGPASKEQQMPIANTQYWDAKHAIPALWCWILGLREDGSNALEPIDYASCDIDSMPPVVTQEGEASTYSSLYNDVLLARCSSCHKPGAKDTTLSFADASLTYSTLLGISGSGPSETSEMPYVTKNDPERSFLFLKISGDPKAGKRMPLGGDPLPDSVIDGVRTWIEQGAYEN